MPLDMIKPFKILTSTEIEGGVRRIEYSVRKSEKTANGVLVHELSSVVFIEPGVDVDAYLMSHIEQQGWL